MTSRKSSRFLAMHGHFYQPPRENPFTHEIPEEPGASPYPNFNIKIDAECYQPNAKAGNFERISFDLGPTLADWLEKNDPVTYLQIIESEKAHFQKYGYGNALAQAYNHTILPLMSDQDKRTQIRWGILDFQKRFGHYPEGMWLPETAADLQTLAELVNQNIQFTILAPWQAATAVDVTEPYIVKLPEGKEITVFFYNAPLSGNVSFDWDTTSNADLFAAHYLPWHVNQEKQKQGTSQITVVASDGELYGHHKPWRDYFLERLTTYSAKSYGYQITSLATYLAKNPAKKEVELQTPSSWSCHHGIDRWSTGCSCTEGSSSWKFPLLNALKSLQVESNKIFERECSPILRDIWEARNDYLEYHNGWVSEEAFWQKHLQSAADGAMKERIKTLLEAQYYIQCSFTSCGFFFEDLDRIEPKNDIAFARKSMSLTWQATQIDLQPEFLRILAFAKSNKSNLTGTDIYRSLPAIDKSLLPPLPKGKAKDESAA